MTLGYLGRGTVTRDGDIHGLDVRHLRPTARMVAEERSCPDALRRQNSAAVSDVERSYRHDESCQARYDQEPGRVPGHIGCHGDARDANEENDGGNPPSSQPLATLRQPILGRIHGPNPNRRGEFAPSISDREWSF